MCPETIPTGPQTQRADAMFDAVFYQSFEFRIQLSFEDAQQFIRCIHEFNEFYAPYVLLALNFIDRLIQGYRALCVD